MAVKQTGRFASEADYLKTLAKTNELFNQNTYADMVAQGRGAEYSAAIYGTKDKTSDTFDFGSYNLLSGADQYAYVVNEFYVDRNEYKTDEKTGERYNVYERNKEYLDYQIDEQIKENIYNSLNGWEKFIYSVSGFVGDIVSTIYSIGEGVVDAVLFLSEGIGRLGEALGSEVMGESADLIREWASYDTTGARAFQAEMEDFTKKYTVWDKTGFTSTVREVYTSIAKMAPLALNIVAPGAGSAIYYSSMAGDVYNQTIQANPDIDYGNLFAYVAGSTALEAGVEWASAKVFGGDTISKLIGFKGTDKVTTGGVKSLFGKMGMDMFTEGLEEGVTEIFGTLLEQATVDPNANLTIQDILHAALVGAITGGVMTGGSILGTKSLVVDSKTGDFMVDDKGNYVTWNQLTKEQKQTLGKQAKVGKVNTIAFKEGLAAYADSLTNVSEVTKLKNKYNENVDVLQKNHADEYNEAVTKDTETYKQQGMNALKLAALMETIGVDGFQKAVQTLQNANDKAIDLIDKYLNKRSGATAQLQAIQARFEKDNPGVNISFKESLTNDERRIQNAIKAAYGTDVYFVDFGSNNGLNPGTFKRGVNEIFINSENVKNMSYQKLLNDVIKQELVNATTNADIISQNDFRKLIETMLPDGAKVTEMTPEIKTTMVQKLLFEDITVAKMFDTNKGLFYRLSKLFNKLKKENRMARKDDANKIEFNQLLKIRQRYVDAVANAIGNESDVEQAKVVMELSDDEVQHIKDKYQTDATNEHMILMKTNFTQNASEKRDIERFLINNRLGDKRLKLDYSQIYNTEYYKETFVQEVLDAYPGKLFKDALWYYVSDKYGYAISQINNTIYKQVDLISQSDPKFINTLTQAIENKDTTNLIEYVKIQNILKPEFLKAFDTTELNRITIQYENVLSVNGRTVINPNGTITIQVNTDANHINQLQYELYHEISHALGYVQGFSYGTSYATMVSTLNAEKPSIIKSLAAKILEPEFVMSATQSELVDALAYQLYLMSEGERYASGKKESFAKDADGFIVTETEIQGVGKFASFKTTLVGPTTTAEYVERESQNAGARFVRETNITDLSTEGFSEEFIEAYDKKILNKNIMWQLISRNKVGSKEATNKLISWLSAGNKVMTSIDDINNALLNGIAYATTYYGYKYDKQSKKITKPEWDTRTNVNYEYLQSEFEDKDSVLYKNYIGKTWVDEYGDFKRKHGISERINKLFEKEGNQYAIYRWLVENDYDYSDSKTGELLRKLQQKGGINPSAETKTLETTQQVKGFETATTSKEDIKEYQAWEESLYNEEPTQSVEEMLNDVVKNKDLDSLVNALQKTTQKLQNSAEAFTLRNQITEKRAYLEKTFGEGSYKQILKAAPARKDYYTDQTKTLKENLRNKTSLTETEQKLLDMDDIGFSPNNYEIYIEYLKGTEIPNPDTYFEAMKKVNEDWLKQQEQKKKTEEPKISDQEKYAGEVKRGKVIDGKFMTTEEIEQAETDKKEALENAKIVSEDKNVLGREVLKKTEPVVVEQPTVETAKDGVQSGVINIKKPNTIAQAILNNFKEATQGISEAQFFDDTDMAYQKVGEKMLDESAELFVTITDENYLDVRNAIKADTNFYADQALLVFDLYTLEMKGKFSKEIQDKIEAFNRRDLTKSAQKLALQAKRVAARKPVTNLLNQFNKQGYVAKITDEQLQEYDQKLKNKDAYIEELGNKIKQLEEEIKSTKNELEKKALLQEAKEVSKHKTVIEHGSNEDIADWVVTHTDSYETETQIKKDLVDKALAAAKRAEAENKNIGYFFYNKDGTPKPFPKAREIVFNTLKKLKSFRMWAMLSSPVTWARNWIGNKGMQALDGATNAVERFISKRVGFDTTQMKFNETRAGKDVYDHIAKTNENFIYDLIRSEGVRYDPSGERSAELSRQVRAKEYESANMFRKLCLKAQDATDWGLSTGFLGDEPVVFNSICKNIGNLVASNTDFLLKGISTELEPLNKKSTLSSDQQKRKTLLQKAIETKNATDIFDAISKEETARLFDQAKTMAFQQYFKNGNAFNKWMNNLALKNPIAAEVVSWIMPFPKVAMNVLTMAYRYSPLGFVSGVMQWSQARQVTTEGYKGESTGFEQAKMVRTFSEASVGTFMLIVGAIAAALGWVDIDEDDYLGPCLHFGDIRISLSELAPSMTTFSTAAAMIWAYKNEKSVVSEALNVLYDNTLLGNVENLFRYSSLESFGQNLSISYISQYIPAVVKWVNKSLLQTPTKDKSGPYFTKLAKTLGSYIPGVSLLVPDKIDPYTGKKVYSTGTDNWFYNFIATSFPLDVKFDSKQGVAEEAYRLGVKTTGLDGSFTINGEKMSATGKTKENLAVFRANYIQSEYKKMMNGQKITVEDENGKRVTTTYDKLTDEQKRRVFENLYTRATTVSKIEYWTSLGNKYIVTNRDDLKTYRDLITKQSNIIYKQSWSKSKFVEG